MILDRLRLGAILLTLGVAASLVAAVNDTPVIVGDGRISTSPRMGYVYSCQTQFRPGPGLQKGGPWIEEDRWYPGRKPRVEGEVSWPATFAIEPAGDRRGIRGNSLPNHVTGHFPIRRTDPAYRHDPNPNAIREQPLLATLPLMPTMAAEPGCVPMGPIGFALSGAYIYNALDAQGRDAPVHEMQDRCNGHPEGNGRYHYHNWSPCLSDSAGAAGRHSDLVAYARDGFGIFGPHGAGGKVLTNQDLDACHGHQHEIEWDGRRVDLYHYHYTREYPYAVGCFRGTPVALARPAQDGKGGAASKKGSPSTGEQPIAVAARELGLDADRLRQALGPPPPDFSSAAASLGIDEQRLRDVMQRARGR